MSHSTWKIRRTRELLSSEERSPELQQLDREITLSLSLAKVVYDRRKELGLSQTAAAERCGLTQAKISRIEGSGAVPTLPLLAKLAKGLNASLVLHIDSGDAGITLTAQDDAA